MKVVVLGAGVIGVTTAYALARAGCEVVVIERRPDVGLETSYANAGEVTPSGASPWASPRLPTLVLRWMLRGDSPLKVRLGLDPQTWRWMAQILGQCAARRFETNRRRLTRLANYSRDLLRDLRAEIRLDYDAKSSGVLHLYRSQRELDLAAEELGDLAELGVRATPMDWMACKQVEPGLGDARSMFAGGLHFPDDETGDCLKFTRSLAGHAMEFGVEFRFNHQLQRFSTSGGRVEAAVTDKGAIRGDAYVLALGSWSPGLVSDLGLKLPIHPVKGYSLTVRAEDMARGPRGGIMDEDRKIAVTRLGDRIRVAGMAELANFSTALPPARRRSLTRTLDDLFPNATRATEESFWSGLRPMTPDGAPILGSSPLPNLYLNTGHGTLGWTMACGSAQVIADLLHGRPPAIDTGDLGLDRHWRN